MNETEKSVMLVRAMGWESRSLNDDEGNIGYFDHNGDDILPLYPDLTYLEIVLAPNFYDPANMALAKRAILWGYNFIPAFQKWLHKDGCALAVLIGAGGYGLALDRLLLELNIEAGVDGPA